MNSSDFSHQSNNDTQSQYFYQTFSYRQFLAIILAGSAFLFSLVVLLFLVIICQKYRIQARKSSVARLTSNNPCYVGSFVGQFSSSNNNAGHAHCNMSVSTDFYDIDDLDSLDNDSFLNSLENAIFVGYLNHSRPTVVPNDRFSHSTVHKNNSVHSESQNLTLFNKDSSKRPYVKSAPLRYSNSNSSVKLRTGKSGGFMSKTNHSQEQMRIRAKSEAISESIGSTSNLITSSKMFLDDSTDSVCGDPHDLERILARDSCETNVDHKTGSSSNSHTSMNSTNAMMSPSPVNKSSVSQDLPDIINSSLSRSTDKLRKTSNAFQHLVDHDDPGILRSGDVIDPLRPGQESYFVTETGHGSMNRVLLQQPFSLNMSGDRGPLFEY